MEAGCDVVDKTMETCEELLRVSRAQQRAITENMVELLDELLDERERLISRIDLSDVGSITKGVSADHAGGAGTCIVEKFRELLRIDEENRRALQARLAEVKLELLRVNKGRDLLGGYAYGNVRTESIYIDTLG